MVVLVISKCSGSTDMVDHNPTADASSTCSIIIQKEKYCCKINANSLARLNSFGIWGKAEILNRHASSVMVLRLSTSTIASCTHLLHIHIHMKHKYEQPYTKIAVPCVAGSLSYLNVLQTTQSPYTTSVLMLLFKSARWSNCVITGKGSMVLLCCTAKSQCAS